MVYKRTTTMPSAGWSVHYATGGRRQPANLRRLGEIQRPAAAV